MSVHLADKSIINASPWIFLSRYTIGNIYAFLLITGDTDAPF